MGGIVLCKSGDVEISMLLVCILRGEKRKEVKAGRRDIYTQVLAISWFNFSILFVNKHKTAQHTSCRTTCHLMNNKPEDEN
jgi:hypothetical protein